MCGLALLLSVPGAALPETRAQVEQMLQAIRHRGPDDGGTWSDDAVGVHLGQRRLSILDTSERGHQPMVSASGRFVIAYNGEIYNYREVRAEMSDVEWRSESDTEVLLEAIERFGLEAALGKMAGMFAFALYDRKEREVILARDRMGKKPLYYGENSGRFLVASELSAFRAVCSDLRIDEEAMGLLARFGFIVDPYSVFRGVKKLLPGTYLRAKVEQMQAGRAGEPTPYFRLEDAILAGAESRKREWSSEEVLATVEAELETAVKQRLRTDVPFGAFLSGGIDSSLVVALMQKHVSAKVKTFALGFDDPAFDESRHAAKIAAYLGTEHEELMVTERDVLDLVPQMVAVYDEPFADSSQLPTTLVARLARKHVTVVLTGDGGDEVFAGYNRHVWGERAWRVLSWVPRSARGSLSQALLRVSAEGWDRISSVASPVLPERFRVRQAGEKMRKLARLSASATPEAMHLNLATHWLTEENVTGRRPPVRTRAESAPEFLRDLSPLERALWFDTAQGLPGDMLVKVDRATMNVGLEARQPLLDHRLYEASWRIPDGFKRRGGVGKWPLREILAKHVPRDLWERPKSGFSVPLDAWLRGPLREWSEELLSERSLVEYGIFAREPVRAAWNAHLSGKENHGARLWTVLSGQAFLQAFRAGDGRVGNGPRVQSCP